MVIALGSLAGPLRAQTAAAPLQTWDALLPFRQGTALWARNFSADTVWVDSLFVGACRNVRSSTCGDFALGLPIPPGEKRELLRIRPQLTAESLSYRWTYSWRVVTSVPAEVQAEDPDTT
jgi:hypothetical protein